MRFLTAVALALVMLWVPVDGVAQDRNPLKGLTMLDPEVRVAWNESIRFPSKEQFMQNVETALELGLLRAGLKTGDFPKKLFCTITTTSANGVLVAGMVEVSLVEIVYASVPPGVPSGEVQWATTWQDGMAFLKNGFQEGKERGEWCAEIFELAWRRANN